MQVRINGKELYIGWVHNKADDHRLLPRTTICFITKTVENGTIRPVIVGSGTYSNVNEKNFCYDTARKKALSQAMKRFPRIQRIHVWKKYFSRSPKYHAIIEQISATEANKREPVEIA